MHKQGYCEGEITERQKERKEEGFGMCERVDVFASVAVMEKCAWGKKEAENWCYQYLTNPSSIFMADNRADMQLSHVSGSGFITL